MVLRAKVFFLVCGCLMTALAMAQVSSESFSDIKFESSSNQDGTLRILTESPVSPYETKEDRLRYLRAGVRFYASEKGVTLTMRTRVSSSDGVTNKNHVVSAALVDILEESVDDESGVAKGDFTVKVSYDDAVVDKISAYPELVTEIESIRNELVRLSANLAAPRESFELVKQRSMSALNLALQLDGLRRNAMALNVNRFEEDLHKAVLETNKLKSDIEAAVEWLKEGYSFEVVGQDVVMNGGEPRIKVRIRISFTPKWRKPTVSFERYRENEVSRRSAFSGHYLFDISEMPEEYKVVLVGIEDTALVARFSMNGDEKREIVLGRFCYERGGEAYLWSCAKSLTNTRPIFVYLMPNKWDVSFDFPYSGSVGFVETELEVVNKQALFGSKVLGVQ